MLCTVITSPLLFTYMMHTFFFSHCFFVAWHLILHGAFFLGLWLSTLYFMVPSFMDFIASLQVPPMKPGATAKTTGWPAAKASARAARSW